MLPCAFHIQMSAHYDCSFVQAIEQFLAVIDLVVTLYVSTLQRCNDTFILLYIYNAPCIRVKNLLKGANKVMLNNFK